MLLHGMQSLLSWYFCGLFDGGECSVQNLHLNCLERAIVPEGVTFSEQFEPGTNHVHGYWCGLTERI